MLDKRQLKVCELLSNGIPITEIATQVGVSRQSIYDWKKTEEFKATIDALGQEFLSQTIGMIGVEGPRCIKKLAYLRDHAESEKVQLDAASKILDKIVSNALKIDVDMNTDNKDNVPTDVLDKELEEFHNV